MSSSPQVSIIIPAYNAEPFIKDALYSIQQQTFEDYEVLVIDDHSIDDTFGVAGKYGAQIFGPRINMLTRPKDHPRGPAAARNEGLRVARGEYVAFLDADDIWLPDHLEVAMDLLKRCKDLVGVHYSRMETFGDSHLTRTRGGEGIENEPFDASSWLLSSCCVCLPSSVVKASLLKDVRGFDERLKNCMDWWLWLRLSKRTPFFFNPAITSRMRIHSQSTTRQWPNQTVNRLRLWQIAKKSGELTEYEMSQLRIPTVDHAVESLFLFMRMPALLPLCRAVACALLDGPAGWGLWSVVFARAIGAYVHRAWRSGLVRMGLIRPEDQFH